MVLLAGALILLTGRGPRLGDIPPGPPPPLAAKSSAPAPAPPAPVAAAPREPAAATPAAGAMAPAPAATTPIAAPAPGSPAATLVVATPPPSAPPTPAGLRRLHIRATERTWLRVQSDEEAPRDATLEPGTSREWTATRRFLLTVGNAGGLELTLDGRRLAPLGARGAVIRDLVLPEAAPGAGS
jgi:cytoskeleton protein RodZ